ncbi:MFS transporter [Halobaculum gomorrense]|uniref:Major Facilitator Superfamily protein n=1 Tax=Halobaculum gomorrense TaxID=43928 RepID=A0A1M5SV29_9EURY|nr:MFS transporter [Halobaculum gomorrense]SHH42382.1 Major Facilitator Superfamily protein [Halobaculum gomorrense]
MVSLVRRYYFYRASLSSGFYIPVSVIYMESRGLGLPEIGLVQGTFLFSMVVWELPTGYLGDRLGRRAALALGSAVTVAVMAGFALAESTLGFATVYGLWAVAWTFKTGAADAWLYELLATRGEEEEFSRISGRADSVLRLLSGGAALSVGLLYTVDSSLPFLANAALAGIGLPVLFTLPRTNGAGSGDDAAVKDAAVEDAAVDDADPSPIGVREVARVLRRELSRPSIRWVVAYAALFNLAFSVTRVFEQPAMRSVGVPVAGLGLLYAGFKLVSAIVSSLTGAVHDRLGTRGVLFLLVPAVGVAYGAFAVVPALLVPALFLRRGLQRITRPVRTEYVNDRVEDVGRATVLSGVSMALTLASGTANVLGGRVAEAVGPLRFLSATGVAVSLAAGILWIAVRPVRSAAGDPAPS